MNHENEQQVIGAGQYIKIQALTQPPVLDFLWANRHADVVSLLMKGSLNKFEGISPADLAAQISGRQKLKLKHPPWYENRNLLFPPALNLEQSSSWQTAEYKAEIYAEAVSLLCPASECDLVDLTGGFGIDSASFAKRFKSVVHVEPSLQLHQIVGYNFEKAGLTNTSTFLGTAEEYLAAPAINTINPSVNPIAYYIDPSRRTDKGLKATGFAACTPNVLDLVPAVFQSGSMLMVKASPMDDIQFDIRELSSAGATCRSVFAVAVAGELKELLYILTPQYQQNEAPEPVINAVNLNSGQTALLSFTRTAEQIAESRYSVPLKYLYEPNAAVLKAGAFKVVAQKFGLFKLHPNTHLYTSDKLVVEFPGRIFEIAELLPVSGKALKEHLPGMKANLSVRNFPIGVDDLRKQLKLKEGGDFHVFAFTAGEDSNKTLAITKRVSLLLKIN